MKKIIVDGKSRNKTHTFKCPNKNCGCVFKADMNDYWYLDSSNKECNTVTNTVASQCPSCCDVVIKDITRCDKRSIVKKKPKFTSKSIIDTLSFIGLLLNSTIMLACIYYLPSSSNSSNFNVDYAMCCLGLTILCLYNVIGFGILCIMAIDNSFEEDNK